MFGVNYPGGPYFGQGWPGAPTPDEPPPPSAVPRIILVDNRLAMRIGGIIHHSLN